MAEPSIVTNALRLADDGWKVFPCDDQKAPVCKSGFKAASDDPIEIVRLFSLPNARLIGRPTGAESGLVVVDIDIKGGKDGRQWPRYGDLPATRPLAYIAPRLHWSSAFKCLVRAYNFCILFCSEIGLSRLYWERAYSC